MAIESGLYKFLNAQDAVTAIMVSGPFFSLIKQGALLPTVVIHRIATIPTVTLDTTLPLEEGRFQFDCYAGDYFACHALATAIKEALQDFSGALAEDEATIVQACVLNNGPFDAPYELGGKTPSMRVILDISIWFSTTGTSSPLGDNNLVVDGGSN